MNYKDNVFKSIAENIFVGTEKLIDAQKELMNIGEHELSSELHKLIDKICDYSIQKEEIAKWG